MGARRRFPKGDRKLRLFSCPLVASAEAIPLRSETALHGSRISHRHRTDSRKRARSPLSPGTAAPHCSFVLIAVRVRFLPAPRVAAHVFQRLGCRPAEQLLRLRRVGIAGIHIAVAARANHIWHGNLVHAAERVHNIQHRVANARTKVDRFSRRDRRRI